MSQTKQLQILNFGLLTETEVIATQLEGLPQVIRRDEPGHDSGKQRVVSWLGHKIERAVGAACVAQGSDPVLAKEARSTIETRLLKERPLFIHVEQLQDIVEETLIDLGHPKIALAYGKYRARRAAERELARSPRPEDLEGQMELASAEQLHDIRARISFAKIGLHMGLPDQELISRLLQSASINLSPEDRRDTIILNARSLLDLDADARFFAARILLSYVYEDTLTWKISDGLEALQEAHRRAFVEYIPKGIALHRLDPRLADFDLRRLSKALVPFYGSEIRFYRNSDALRSLPHSHPRPAYEI